MIYRLAGSQNERSDVKGGREKPSDLCGEALGASGQLGAAGRGARELGGRSTGPAPATPALPAPLGP